MSSATSTLKRKQQDESPASKRQKENDQTMSVFNILDIQCEILIKIISYLNARERVPLGNSCKIFRGLVFEDASLLRELDFSKEGRLTSAADIHQYFNNKKTYEHILGVNIKNTNCIDPGYLLNDSIGRAMNLVDINLHGTQFKDVWQLGSFLQPLQHIQRLSFDWSETYGGHIPLCYKVLQKPFGRLTYLSVEMDTLGLLKVFIHSLQLCQELRELRLVIVKSPGGIVGNDVWSGEPRQLENLKIVQYYGPCAMRIKERFVTILSNPEEWADFQFHLKPTDPKGFHIENLRFGEKLLNTNWIASVPNDVPENQSTLGWKLYPEVLLKEVLENTFENVPEEFCCLSTFMEGGRCLMKINEATRLLKNPGSRISYLYVSHPIELGCDIHLLVSAFSNLTELVLTGVTRKLDSFPKDQHFERCLRKKGCAVNGKQDDSLNMSSSFKMLIDNTPKLKHLTLGDSDNTYPNWDLDELYLIPRWENLESLRLVCIPIKNGKFLIEIGKRCKNLQKLELTSLGSNPNAPCCYETEMLQMLRHCKNLRDFFIHQANIADVSALFTSLASNVQLNRVHLRNLRYIHTSAVFISSIVQLVNQCSKLTTFICELRDRNPQFRQSDLKRTIKRFKHEERHRNLQIKVSYHDSCGFLSKIGSVNEDAPHHDPFFGQAF